MSIKSHHHIVSLCSIALLWSLLLIGMHADLAANCSKPFGLSFLNRTTTTIEIRWSDGNINPDGWELELVQRGKNPSGTPNVINLVSRNYILNNLNNSSAYDLYIRTKCSPSSFSDWNGPFLFTTVFTNPTPCSINVPVKDNGTETFFLQVNDSGILGADIFVASVELIMEHTWPADMQISLETPSGKSIILSNHNGTVTDDFGDIQDNTCVNVTTFDSDACLSLKNSRPPYIGRFRPDESFSLLEDNSSSSGIWKLKTLDRATQDIGIIRFFKINFSSERCITPDLFIISEIGNNSIDVEWNAFPLCNAVQISVGYPGLPADSLLKFFVNCQNKKFTITGLLPNTEYQVFINAICGTGLSAGSCPAIFKTSCESATVTESFDALNRCVEGCAFSCEIDGVWKNVDYDGIQDWIIWSGKTDTDNTGPEQDVSGIGNYLYIENNPEICGSNNTVILESECVKFGSNPSGCDMSFYYHMFGKDIQSLSLEINNSGFDKWEKIFTASGAKNELWHQATLDLSTYDGQIGRFRFVGKSGDGIFADMALDQIEFYKSTISDGLRRYYTDADRDGYGTSTDFIDLCTTTVPEGYASIGGDCDDNDPEINPGQTEIPCNLKDENCNGNEDDNPVFNPILYNVNVVNESCTGFSDGTLELSITGGTPPYNVTWNNGTSGLLNDNLKGGIYYAEITDFGGCMKRTKFVELKTNTQINFTVLSIERPSCEGKEDGNIIIAHSGGTPPFNYKWSNDTTTKDLTAIGSGAYRLTIHDGTGCTFVSTEITVTSRPSVLADITRIKSPSCFELSNGELEIAAINGSPPYTYVWNNGVTGNKLTAIPSGTYTSSVTDSQGCLFIFNAKVNSPPQLKSEIISIEQVRCHGENNGAIKTNTSGGVPPYTYLWNNFLFTESIFDIPAGRYNLQINDKNGCETKLENIRVPQPEKLTSRVDSIVPSICPLGQNGRIRISASGGIPEYAYAWKNSDSDYFIADKLQTGIYSVTTFDRNGCKANLNNIHLPFINIPVISELNILEENRCYLGQNAVINAKVLNGTPPYDFNWSNGLQRIRPIAADTIFKLPAGMYNLTVTDALGCFGSATTLTIPEKTLYNYSVLSSSGNICPDDQSGSIEIKINGGTPPINVLWNDNPGGQYIENLRNGIYSGIIKDANGCELLINPVAITSMSNLSVRADVTKATPGNADGKICLNIDGAVFPVAVTWSQSGAIHNHCAENLSPGTYRITVTDDLDCTEIIELNVDVSTGSTEINKHNKIKIYPNPAADKITILTEPKKVNLHILDMTLKKVRQWSDLELPATLDVSAFNSGQYILQIFSDQAMESTLFIKL
jgi:subtilisin-like proprotein convertase family protein